VLAAAIAVGALVALAPAPVSGSGGTDDQFTSFEVVLRRQ
jgi:hypothetical protein